MEGIRVHTYGIISDCVIDLLPSACVLSVGMYVYNPYRVAPGRRHNDVVTGIIFQCTTSLITKNRRELLFQNRAGAVCAKKVVAVDCGAANASC